MVSLFAAFLASGPIEAGPHDALDDPWSIAAAPDGGFWVALQTDTVTGLSYYPPDRSSHLDFMAWVMVPSLAVDGAGNLYVGGDGVSVLWGSRILQYSADGRHQRSWVIHPSQIVDLDLAADGALVTLEARMNSAGDWVWPPAADRIVRYSLAGQRLGEQRFAPGMIEIAADTDGSLFIASEREGGGSRITQHLPDGAPGGILDLDGRVVGMDLDKAGDLYVAELSKPGEGRAGRFRIREGAFREIESWAACHEPRDLAVGTDGRVILLARTPETVETSISAICEYDQAGAPLREYQIPFFTGAPAPTATPRPGEIAWLPSLLRGR
jgi:hypothetical protein